VHDQTQALKHTETIKDLELRGGMLMLRSAVLGLLAAMRSAFVAASHKGVRGERRNATGYWVLVAVLRPRRIQRMTWCKEVGLVEFQLVVPCGLGVVGVFC
jgi:hypothetical protein